MAASLANRLIRRARLLRMRGDTVECPCCGGTFSEWAAGGERGYRVCPRCGGQERHRAVALWLERQTDLFSVPGRSVLHWAPERALGGRLSRQPGIDYLSADLDPDLAMAEMDITDIPRPDDSFDVILCIHVLEHIPDDAKAMSELHRILKPGGWMLALVPLDLDRAETYEDASIVSPEDRAREFWQFDHVRLYARDFADRLRAAGFEVEVDPWVRSLPPAEVERYGLFPQEDMYVCRKGGGAS